MSTPPISAYTLSTWFERDRARVALEDSATGKTVVEWLDGDVSQAIEDGFLDTKAFIMGRLHNAELLKRSAYDYAISVGLIK